MAYRERGVRDSSPDEATPPKRRYRIQDIVNTRPLPFTSGESSSSFSPPVQESIEKIEVEGTLAQGEGTLAQGEGTLAQGEGTLAQGEGTLAQGQNIEAAAQVVNVPLPQVRGCRKIRIVDVDRTGEIQYRFVGEDEAGKEPRIFWFPIYNADTFIYYYYYLKRQEYFMHSGLLPVEDILMRKADSLIGTELYEVNTQRSVNLVIFREIVLTITAPKIPGINETVEAPLSYKERGSPIVFLHFDEKSHVLITYLMRTAMRELRKCGFQFTKLEYFEPDVMYVLANPDPAENEYRRVVLGDASGKQMQSHEIVVYEIDVGRERTVPKSWIYLVEEVCKELKSAPAQATKIKVLSMNGILEEEAMLEELWNFTDVCKSVTVTRSGMDEDPEICADLSSPHNDLMARLEALNFEN